MTACCLRPMFECHPVAAAWGHAALLLAQNRVPEEVMNALRHGRLTALRKLDGSGISSGEWWLARLRNRTPKRWKRPRHPRRKQGARQWQTFSRSSPIWTQGEGGEQGDPLMPLLFCLGQHPALSAASAQLEPGEKLFAYLDEIYIVCRPERVGAVFNLLE